ncbi:MAG: cbb3-type cytochrome oxidase assembly protein CcoS [Pseudomonadota bacterium]
MSILLILVPAALLLGVLGLFAFFWAVNADQFDDPDGAARRILSDDKPTNPPGPPADPQG